MADPKSGGSGGSEYLRGRMGGGMETSQPAPKAAQAPGVGRVVIAIQAEVSAALRESKALQEELRRAGKSTDAELAAVIAARLATIEGHVKTLSAA